MAALRSPLRARRSMSWRYASSRHGSSAINRLIALDPWREEAYRQLMLLLARNGERSAAIAQYMACRRVLAEELDVEPMEETTALYRRLIAEPTVPPHRL